MRGNKQTGEAAHPDAHAGNPDLYIRRRKPPTGGTTASNVTKYYCFGALRVAMRTSAGVTYLFGDHLGSTSAAIDQNGQLTRQGYYAFGGRRYAIGTLPTDYTFTGQKSDASDGLMYYGARYYAADTEVTMITRLGRRRLNVVVYNKQGDIILGIEAKTGNSPYTYTQSLKDDRLMCEGGFPIIKLREGTFDVPPLPSEIWGP